jgi:hypothetical protein
MYIEFHLVHIFSHTLLIDWPSLFLIIAIEAEADQMGKSFDFLSIDSDSRTVAYFRAATFNLKSSSTIFRQQIRSAAPWAGSRVEHRVNACR